MWHQPHPWGQTGSGKLSHLSITNCVLIDTFRCVSIQMCSKGFDGVRALVLMKEPDVYLFLFLRLRTM